MQKQEGKVLTSGRQITPISTITKRYDNSYLPQPFRLPTINR